MGQKIDGIIEQVKSPRGRNFMTFLLFLVISMVLWIVMTLNEESTRDLRCAVSVSNVPDSIVRITPIPPFINVSVRSRGTSMMKYLFTDDLNMNIDYRNYVTGNQILFKEQALKGFFRAKLGSDVQIQSVTPDSLSIFFSDNKGIKLPVKVDEHVVPGPQFAVVGKIRSLTDSVTLYSIDPLPRKMKNISTMPIVLNDVRTSQIIRVAIRTDKNMRAIPDSVDVRIDVEPLISKSRMVDVSTVNVPDRIRLIPVPNQVEVYYMVPMSIYKLADSNPVFKVQADYKSVKEGDNKIAISLKSAPNNFMNVFLDTDSVEFIIETK